MITMLTCVGINADSSAWVSNTRSPRVWVFIHRPCLHCHSGSQCRFVGVGVKYPTSLDPLLLWQVVCGSGYCRSCCALHEGSGPIWGCCSSVMRVWEKAERPGVSPSLSIVSSSDVSRASVHGIASCGSSARWSTAQLGAVVLISDSMPLSPLSRGNLSPVHLGLGSRGSHRWGERFRVRRNPTLQVR
jgi:hypothetical protein